MTTFSTHARELARTFAPSRGSAAFAIVADDDVELVSQRHTGLFEAGSLTKTLAATVLAQLVVEEQITLETTIGELLGDAAASCRQVTLLQLATHTSGLPRLPPGILRPPFWPRDPYRYFGRRRLIRSLATVDPTPGTFEYSNYGFSLLGRCLERASGASLRDLMSALIFGPLNMETARCAPSKKRGLERGHGEWLTGGRRWHNPNPGAGGVDLGIEDLGRWLFANTYPESTPLHRAIRLTHEIHFDGDTRLGLAWHQTSNGTIWHNGATGSFRSMAAIKPGQHAIGALVASGRPNDGADEQILRLTDDPTSAMRPWQVG